MDKKINIKIRAASSALLEELLLDVESEQERQALIKAWAALDGLDGEKNFPIKPSQELELIFRNCNHGLVVDEQIADDELELLAAAGTNVTPATPDAPSPHGDSGDYPTKEKPQKNDLTECSADDTLMKFSNEKDRPEYEKKENLIDQVGNDVQRGTDGDIFYFSGIDCAENIIDFIPGEDIIQFGVNVVLETMFISVNDIGDIVINFPDATFTLVGVKGDAWELNSDMSVEAMTHKILDLCWIDFSSNEAF